MKILVLTKSYPTPEGGHKRMYVHVRNLYYHDHGIDVTVLNFCAKSNYVLDCIPVITLDSFNDSSAHYDIAISHAANVRNHYRFLKKHQSEFQNLIFFFHGYEISYLTKDYPPPYFYDRAAKWYRRVMQLQYDRFKLFLWHRFYKKLYFKSEFVFVSNSIFQRFKKNIKLTEHDLHDHWHIINNSVGKIFEEQSYDPLYNKKFDFITIRSDLDGSKYCADIVVKMAEKYPEKNFLLIGDGHFFVHNEKPDNMTWVAKTLSHEEMIKYINASRWAFMPTREDTQGVMTCELATFGIPVITSNIDVCHEFFDGLANVYMISNDPDCIDLRIADCIPSKNVTKCTKWFANQTIAKEVELMQEITATQTIPG